MEYTPPHPTQRPVKMSTFVCEENSETDKETDKVVLPYACFATYIHTNTHNVCLPANIHYFSISGYPYSLLSKFYYLNISGIGISKNMEIWKSRNLASIFRFVPPRLSPHEVCNNRCSGPTECITG